MERSNELSMDQAFLKKLKDSVFNNLTNEQFGAEELASDIGMSRSQIHRKLQKINGKSVTQFIREIRLKEAHRLLKNNTGTASEIAYQVGFNSPTYFSKCFHEFYGYTPGEVKKRMSSKRKLHGLITSKYIGSSLVVVGILVIIYISHLFLPGNYTKYSEPPVPSTEFSDVSAAKSIAVIPFEFHGEDSAYNFYSDGMVSEILNHLYKVGDLFVKSDILSRKFANTGLTAKEVGEAFGVNYILKGSVLMAGDVIRITPRLIDARTNELLWSHSFESKMTDISEIITIQSNVAKKVAFECKASISPEAEALIRGSPAPENNLAYEFYLKGQDYWKSKGDHVLAMDMYSKAIEADPSFAPAYAGRAIMHAEAYWAKTSDNWLDHDPLAFTDIQKAIQLEPASLEAKFAQCSYNYYILRDYEEALDILNDLKKKMPNMAGLYATTAWIKRRQGKWQESIAEEEKAVELEPFNVIYMSSLAISYSSLRQFDSAIAIARDGLDKVPDFKPFRRLIFQFTKKKTGNLKLATEAAGLEKRDMPYVYYLSFRQFDKLIEYIKNNQFEGLSANNFHPMSHELALAYHYNGDTNMSKIYADSAIQLLEKKLAQNPLDHRLAAPLSKCYAILGDREQAIAYGEKSIRDLPLELDARRGIGRETEMAKTYVLVGDYESAMDQIEYLLSVPGPLTVGDLWTKPVYYDLRKFPRFHEILRAHQPDSLYQQMVNQEI